MVEPIPIRETRKPIQRSYRDLEKAGMRVPANSITGDMLAPEFSTIIKIVDYTASTQMVILVNAISGPVIITLPTASSSEDKVYYIKKTDSSSNTVTIEPDGNDTIDDEQIIVIRFQFGYIGIVCGGVKWHIIGGEYVKMEDLIIQLVHEQKETSKILQDIETHLSLGSGEELDKEEN